MLGLVAQAEPGDGLAKGQPVKIDVAEVNRRDL